MIIIQLNFNGGTTLILPPFLGVFLRKAGVETLEVFLSKNLFECCVEDRPFKPKSIPYRKKGAVLHKDTGSSILGGHMS